MKVKKAVIPAAGLGTRMLPISKGVCKEMLPITDRPAMQYLVEEAVGAGITDILIITARGKEVMENYFDYSPDYEGALLKKGKESECAELRRIAEMANITFLRQKEARGLGHAVLCAKSFVGDEPFLVLYGDDIILSEKPTALSMCELYEEFGRGVLASQTVSEEDIKRYSSLKIEPIRDQVFAVSDMVEKPQTKEARFSCQSILGRALLPPSIFDILEKTEPGAGGEIQLTDAMRVLAQTEGMLAYEFEGTRYDMGSKLGFLTANVTQGVLHPECGEEFKAFLKEFAKTL